MDYWRAKARRNVERDRETDALLAAAGWQVVRVWEHEDPAAAAGQIARLVADSTALLARKSPGKER